MNIYVGNLSRSTTEEETRNYLNRTEKSTLSDLITDRYSGEFRGFGFVEMGDKGALEAIVALNMKEVGGRNIKVNEAKPRVRT